MSSRNKFYITKMDRLVLKAITIYSAFQFVFSGNFEALALFSAASFFDIVLISTVDQFSKRSKE
jgi:hypothetical protein